MGAARGAGASGAGADRGGSVKGKRGEHHDLTKPLFDYLDAVYEADIDRMDRYTPASGGMQIREEERKPVKTFNTTAVCIPSKHYMVDISGRIAKIREMVEAGKYFTINRARQYGKTTTLHALQQDLDGDYLVLDMSFEAMSAAAAQTEGEFVQAFSRLMIFQREFLGVAIPDDVIKTMEAYNVQAAETLKLDMLFMVFIKWMRGSEKPVVLLIDEVDASTNNQVFLDFLGLLRNGYIARETRGIPFFQSVILAGVTDVRHLKRKIRPEEQHKVNSPWNIAVPFDLDMSLSEEGIKGMLDEYEADHGTGMDTSLIAKKIREYTNGYPFLASRICQIIDEQSVPDVFESLGEAWTEYGVDEAVKRLMSEDNTLFASLFGELVVYPELKERLRTILLGGETFPFIADDEELKLLQMFGFVYNYHNTIAIANRIFEMRLYNYFIAKSDKNDDLRQSASLDRSIFIKADGSLDIPKIMEHFIAEHNRIHAGNDEKFLEQEGRERFITYVSAIINGTGTYSIEEQTRDQKRMDLVIHYLGRRYVVEMKIWRGERYNEEGERQICAYLDYFGLDTGYLLSFNFNQKKESGVKRVSVGGKTLYEGTV